MGSSENPECEGQRGAWGSPVWIERFGSVSGEIGGGFLKSGDPRCDLFESLSNLALEFEPLPQTAEQQGLIHIVAVLRSIAET